MDDIVRVGVFEGECIGRYVLCGDTVFTEAFDEGLDAEDV